MDGGSWNADLFGAELGASLRGMLAVARDPVGLTRVVAHCGAAAEEVCLGRPLACRAGCPHCCVLNVAVLLPEAAVIADHLRATRSTAELAVLMAALASHGNWGRWMDDEERIARQIWCPFLDRVGSCTIHEVRPLSCRGVGALDRHQCQEAFNPIISDQERVVTADLLRRAAYDVAFTALAAALRQNGLDARSIELGSGVRAFLATPAHGELLRSGQRLPGELWE